MSFLFEWILGIIGNLIASWIYDALKQSPATAVAPTHTLVPETLAYAADRDGHPNQNRRRLAQASERIAYRFLSLYFLYAGLALPLMVKAMTLGREVMLSDARFFGDQLPEFPFDSVLLQPIFIVLAVALSFPTALLAEKVYGVYDRTFGPVSRRERVSILLGTHLAVGSILAVSVTTIYYQMSLLQAAAAVFMIVAAPIALRLTNDRR